MFKNFSNTDLKMLFKRKNRELLNMTLLSRKEVKELHKEIKEIKKELKKRGVEWQD